MVLLFGVPGQLYPGCDCTIEGLESSANQKWEMGTNSPWEPKTRTQHSPLSYDTRVVPNLTY